LLFWAPAATGANAVKAAASTNILFHLVISSLHQRGTQFRVQPIQRSAVRHPAVNREDVIANEFFVIFAAKH
jgi:hypothetical protein